MKPSIKTLTIDQLLDGFEDETKRLHYDPCDSMEPAPFGKYEYRDYIKRQLQRLEGILENAADRMFLTDD